MRKLFFVLPFIALIGAGCINVKPRTSDSGGVFKTADAGVKWEAASILPLPAGVSSIAGVDVANLLFDPSDPDTLYLGTTGNGLLVSYDNAASWLRIKEPQLREGVINAVAVDPSSKCTVYVAKGANVLKTTDCNRTYDTQAFVETNGKSVLVLEEDWYNTETVWLGTAAGDVIKSVDGGKNWSTMNRVRGAVADILIDNADSRIVLVLTQARGLWRSEDGGANWVQLDDELKNVGGGEDGFQLTQTKDGAIQFMINQRGINRSLDHGKTWEALTLLTKPNSVRIYSMAVNPSDANMLSYGTDTTLYTSTDGGTNWATRALPTTRAATALAVDPNDPAALFVGVATIEKK